MARKILAVGAVLAVIGGPAYAADPLVYSPPEQGSPFYGPTSMVAAHVDFALGALFGDGFGGSNSAWIVEGAGRFAMPLANGPWRLEVEATGTAVFDADYALTTYGAYAHIFHKSPQAALGVLAGIVTQDAPWFVVGVEGNWYWNQFVVYGQARYHIASNSEYNFSHLEGGLWYYRNPNHKIGGYLAWEHDEYSSSFEAALAGEYRPPGRPFSIFGRGALITGGVSMSDNTDWMFLAGFRFFTDGPDLWTSDGNVPFRTHYIPYFGDHVL